MAAALSDPSRDDLVSRVRQALAARSPREVSMFGGVSFMVDDSLIVAARRDGDLLVHIRPEQRDALLERGGAPAVMGANRHPMGSEWMTVAPELVASADELDFWLHAALDRL